MVLHVIRDHSQLHALFCTTDTVDTCHTDLHSFYDLTFAFSFLSCNMQHTCQVKVQALVSVACKQTVQCTVPNLQLLSRPQATIKLTLQNGRMPRFARF